MKKTNQTKIQKSETEVEKKNVETTEDGELAQFVEIYFSDLSAVTGGGCYHNKVDCSCAI